MITESDFLPGEHTTGCIQAGGLVQIVTLFV